MATGLVLLGVFLVIERRSPHPLVPLDLFTNRTFSAVNGVTFAVYAALGVFFFLLVLQLQVVAGFSPLAAGTALLPVTAVMLLLSSRTGALADRIGARIPLTAGPLVAAAGLLLVTRVGEDASYVTTVLPAVLVFGLGLSLTVAPLTATVLGSAESRHAGIASGVNNAVARAAGLLSVAVIPVVAGLSGQAYANPEVMADGFRMAMTISAGLLGVGAVLAFALIRTPARVSTAAAPTGVAPTGVAAAPEVVPGSVAGAEVGAGSAVAPDGGVARGDSETDGVGAGFDLAKCLHCGITGPQLHPGPAVSAEAQPGSR